MMQDYCALLYTMWWWWWWWGGGGGGGCRFIQNPLIVKVYQLHSYRSTCTEPIPKL